MRRLRNGSLVENLVERKVLLAAPGMVVDNHLSTFPLPSLRRAVSFESMLAVMKIGSLIAVALTLGGCFIWPSKVAEELDTQVVDANSESPIPHAEVFYPACDFHDFDCSKARLVRTKADDSGQILIDSERHWGVWIPAPGDIPSPNHLIAIWAPGYRTFVFSQANDSINWRVRETKRQDVIEALRAILADHSMNHEYLGPTNDFLGGKIKLVPTKCPPPSHTGRTHPIHFCQR